MLVLGSERLQRLLVLLGARQRQPLLEQPAQFLRLPQPQRLQRRQCDACVRIAGSVPLQRIAHRRQRQAGQTLQNHAPHRRVGILVSLLQQFAGHRRIEPPQLLLDRRQALLRRFGGRLQKQKSEKQ